MARLVPRAALGLAAVALAACSDLSGLGGDSTPLAVIQVQVTGTPPAGSHLRVALVWGDQWLPDLFCFLPPESSGAADAMAAGCRDSFGFVPARVAASTDASPDAPALLELQSLPAADILIGDVTARVAYGSLVAYDDRDQSGNLELGRPYPGDRHFGNGSGDANTADVVLGASFISMTLPDQRLAFREGAFNRNVAFYPRSGCGDPPAGFSVLAAGGFTEEQALAAILAGQLPPEDPATCSEDSVDQATIDVPLPGPDGVDEVACVEPRNDGLARYHEPDADPPLGFDTWTWACASVPELSGSGGGSGSGSGSSTSAQQLVISGQPDNPCKHLRHYVLRGCELDPNCDVPDWDHSAAPPAWWPCDAVTGTP